MPELAHAQHSSDALFLEFDSSSALCRLIYRVLEAFRLQLIPLNRDLIEEEGCCQLDLEGLRQATNSADLDDILEDDPLQAIRAIGVALCEVMSDHQQSSRAIEIRLIPTGLPLMAFRQLRAAMVGRLVKIRGNVVRAGCIRPRLRSLSFMCLRCFSRFMERFPDGIFRNPRRCPSAGCKSKQFRPERDAIETECVNGQRIKLQEVISESQDDEAGDGEDVAGRIPRTIEVELEGSLVDLVAPGDTVVLLGIVKADDSGVTETGRAQVNPACPIYLEGNWLVKEKDLVENRLAPSEETGLLAKINAAICRKDLLPLLVSSFSPSIYGHHLVKFGILLTLFGAGEDPALDTGSSIRIRKDCHLLLVGDPGLGKSQLLAAAAAVAPRGLYVCGNTCSAAGLTATLHHSDIASGGEYGLEAGALVLGDRGVCCIDELDKVPEAVRTSLLEVMEQQQVNLAKAGIVCSLPARTSVMAAANPVGGHYNRSKGLLANIRMDPALLSRFDLVFLLVDRPDAELDRLLTNQVLKTFSARSPPAVKSVPLISQPSELQLEAEGQSPHILARLTRSTGARERLSHLELRHMLAYARSKVFPRLCDEASVLLQSFYLDLRRSHYALQGDNMLPITTRHLESLIRLSEARARMELRQVVLASDVQDIIDLYRYCLFEVTGDLTAPAAAPQSHRPKGSGRSALLKRFITELSQIGVNSGETVFSEHQLRQLHQTLEMTSVYPFLDLIEALNQYGYLLKKPGGRYRLCVT